MIKKFEDGLVSIIMPAYNAEKTIVKSIDSVLKQTYSNWELIVVDDASSDETYNTVKKIKDYRIRLYKLENNKGVAEARNFGIQKSQGRFIAFLDSDDLWYNKKLEKQLEFMLERKLYFTYTSYDMTKDGQYFKTYCAPTKVDFHSQIKGSKIGTLTVMFDRKVVEEFKMKSIGHEDYLAWLELLKKYGPAYGVKDSLAVYDDSNTGISANKIKAARWQYSIYKDYFEIKFFRRIYYFCLYIINGIKKHI